MENIRQRPIRKMRTMTNEKQTKFTLLKYIILPCVQMLKMNPKILEMTAVCCTQSTRRNNVIVKVPLSGKEVGQGLLRRQVPEVGVRRAAGVVQAAEQTVVWYKRYRGSVPWFLAPAADCHASSDGCNADRRAMHALCK